MTLSEFESILQGRYLRGLTVPQPYASMIRSGERTIVVRPRPTYLRPWLLIQAGHAAPHAPEPYPPNEGPGSVIALARLADSRLFEAQDLAAACVEYPAPQEGYAWCLEGVIGLLSLAPISARMRGPRARQELWTPNDRERRLIIAAARRVARRR